MSHIQPRIHPIKTIMDLQNEYRDLVSMGDEHCLRLDRWLPSLYSTVRPIRAGEVVLIMADTGTGKSCILSNIAWYAAKAVMPTIMYQLEMPGSLVYERLAAMQHGITCYQVECAAKEGKYLEPVDLNEIYVCDSPALTLDDVYATTMEWNKTAPEPARVILLDYLGLISSVEKGNAYEQVSAVAKSLKTLAKNSNAVVVVATQMHRRTGEDSQFKEVSLHDAAGSHSIEAVADLLLGAWREAENSPTMFVKVLKNRKGKAGTTVRCKADFATMRIVEEAAQEM